MASVGVSGSAPATGPESVVEFVRCGMALLVHRPTSLILKNSHYQGSSSRQVIHPVELIQDNVPISNEFKDMKVMVAPFQTLPGVNFITVKPTRKLIDFLPPQKLIICGRCHAVCFTNPTPVDKYINHVLSGACSGGSVIHCRGYKYTNLTDFEMFVVFDEEAVSTTKTTLPVTEETPEFVKLGRDVALHTPTMLLLRPRSACDQLLTSPKSIKRMLYAHFTDAPEYAFWSDVYNPTSEANFITIRSFASLLEFGGEPVPVAICTYCHAKCFATGRTELDGIPKLEAHMKDCGNHDQKFQLGFGLGLWFEGRESRFVVFENEELEKFERFDTPAKRDNIRTIFISRFDPESNTTQKGCGSGKRSLEDSEEPSLPSDESEKDQFDDDDDDDDDDKGDSKEGSGEEGEQGDQEDIANEYTLAGNPDFTPLGVSETYVHNESKIMLKKWKSGLFKIFTPPRNGKVSADIQQLYKDSGLMAKTPTASDPVSGAQFTVIKCYPSLISILPTVPLWICQTCQKSCGVVTKERQHFHETHQWHLNVSPTCRPEDMKLVHGVKRTKSSDVYLVFGDDYPLELVEKWRDQRMLKQRKAKDASIARKKKRLSQLAQTEEATVAERVPYVEPPETSQGVLFRGTILISVRDHVMKLQRPYIPDPNILDQSIQLNSERASSKIEKRLLPLDLLSYISEEIRGTSTLETAVRSLPSELFITDSTKSFCMSIQVMWEAQGRRTLLLRTTFVMETDPGLAFPFDREKQNVEQSEKRGLDLPSLSASLLVLQSILCTYHDLSKQFNQTLTNRNLKNLVDVGLEKVEMDPGVAWAIIGGHLKMKYDVLD